MLRINSIWIKQRSFFSKLGSTFNQGIPNHQTTTNKVEPPITKLKSSFNNISKHIQLKATSATKAQKGLFNNEHLTSAEGFNAFKKKAETSVNDLIREAFGAKPRKLVQIFDDISNELCRVADVAEFVRTSHPNADFRQNADEVYAQISQIVEQLNTNHELYMKLKQSLGNDTTLDECDKRVCRLFLADFEQSGISLEKKKRNMFVQINDELIAVLMKFQVNTQMPTELALKDVDEKFKTM
jgi:intermediate peptidase